MPIDRIGVFVRVSISTRCANNVAAAAIAADAIGSTNSQAAKKNPQEQETVATY